MASKEHQKEIKKIKELLDSLQDKINNLQEEKVDLSSKYQRTENHHTKLIDYAEQKHKLKMKGMYGRQEKSRELYNKKRCNIERDIMMYEKLLETELKHLENQELLSKLLD